MPAQLSKKQSASEKTDKFSEKLTFLIEQNRVYYEEAVAERRVSDSKIDDLALAS